VFDTEEIVVKPVAPILRHITVFSGNTILGDGSVIMILDPNGVARSAGVSSRGSAAGSAALPPSSVHSDDRVALLLFRAGDQAANFAVPLSLVARLENIPHEKIEVSNSGYVTQYRGRLMKLIAMRGSADPSGGAPDSLQPVLVFADGERCMGLMVDDIVDVVHDRLRIELGREAGCAEPGLLGSAFIAGQAADIFDTGYWLGLAWGDWLGPAKGSADGKARVLVVEDSPFFRQLLVPILSAAGYEVLAAESAAEALRLRDGGVAVDAIVSDIDMPDLDGLGFARLVRGGGPWSALPLIALTGRGGSDDEGIGRDAGFTDYVQKSQRQALIDSLRQCLTETARIAA
jgi:two-component system chemotaxis sensor kinase CheA